MKDSRPPDFGPLAGVRVVCAGSVLAGPFAAQLMAEWGADVIWVENPNLPDMVRAGSGGFWAEIERRNQRNIALDLHAPDGQTAFLAMVADAEIMIESSRGGQFDRLGLTDEILWQANPKLVIAHVSGFGQRGVAEMVERTCYDPIAQAFGCYMQLQGQSDSPPHPGAGVPGDFFTGTMTASAALAALVRARATGEGESIDVAMFEVLLRVSTIDSMSYLNRGIQPTRGGEQPAGMGAYSCRDGVSVYTVISGTSVLRRALELMGVADPAIYPPGLYYVDRAHPGADRLEAALIAFCASHDAIDVEQKFAAAGVPCSRIFTYDLAEQDPHYRARGVFTAWQSEAHAEPVRGLKIVPDFARRAGRIWRGAAAPGRDNDAVLAEAGYDEAGIEDLRARGIIGGARDER